MFERNKALNLLKDGFKQQFASHVFESEEWLDLCMKLSIEFVDDNIPLVNEDDKEELAMMLSESLKLGNY